VGLRASDDVIPYAEPAVRDDAEGTMRQVEAWKKNTKERGKKKRRD